MVREKSYDDPSLAIADLIGDEPAKHRQKYGKCKRAGAIMLIRPPTNQILRLYRPISSNITSVR